MKARANGDKDAEERYNRDHERYLGVAVQELRTAKGLTQSEVAKRASVSVLWLKKLEANQLTTNYTIRRIDRIARAMGVQIYDLYKRAGELAGPPPWLTRKGRQSDE